MHLFVLIFPLLFLTQSAKAEAEFNLPPIVMEGAPAEALQSDPILPVYQEKVIQDSGSGGIGGSIKEELPLPISETGLPGAASQLRGLGRSAEDVNVQVFGIPLNPAQGGGFNLTSFPQFVWSKYEFKSGPSLASGDPRALSGTLSLLPWSAYALSPKSETLRGTAFYSDAHVRQVSVAGKTDSAALVVGESFGDLSGTAGSLSAQAPVGPARLKLHLLATDMDAVIPGLGGHLLTTRWIPVAQADFDVGRNLLKTSVYYDGTYQRFTSPETKDRIDHFGTENAYFFGEGWELGLSAGSTRFDALDFDPPSENIFRLQLRRTLSWGGFSLDPMVRSTWISGFDPFPEASLGAREDLARTSAIYGRLSYSRRVPSLNDRFYQLPGFFVGNPALAPENDETLVLGTELKPAKLTARLEGFAQWRGDAQLTSVLPGNLYTVLNRGSARIYAGTLDLKYELLPWLQVRNGLTYSNSDISATGESFPYVPELVDLFVVSAQSGAWGGEAIVHLNSRTPVSSAIDLPGLATVDLEAGVDVIRAIHFSLRGENLFDRPAVISVGLPPLRRTISVLVSGTF